MGFRNRYSSAHLGRHTGRQVGSYACSPTYYMLYHQTQATSCDGERSWASQAEKEVRQLQKHWSSAIHIKRQTATDRREICPEQEDDVQFGWYLEDAS